MTNEEIINLLRIEKDCTCWTDNYERQCSKYNLDPNKLLEAYEEAIYRLEMLPEIEQDYKSVASECNDLEEENLKLKKEIKKRRKEKKRWKRRALMYKEALKNVRKMLEQMRNDNRGNI